MPLRVIRYDLRHLIGSSSEVPCGIWHPLAFLRPAFRWPINGTPIFPTWTVTDELVSSFNHLQPSTPTFNLVIHLCMGAPGLGVCSMGVLAFRGLSSALPHVAAPAFLISGSYAGSSSALSLASPPTTWCPKQPQSKPDGLLRHRSSQVREPREEPKEGQEDRGP